MCCWGLLYTGHCAGLPPTALEWDLKLWWVHLEAMVATLMAAQHSASQQHFKLFQKVFDYTFDKVNSYFSIKITSQIDVLSDPYSLKWRIPI